MAIDEIIWRPGDDTNVILRKILMATLAGGGSSGVGGAVTVTGGSLTSAGNVVVTGGTLTSAGAVTVSGGVQQQGALVDRSGSIAVGATSQQVAAASATRKYFIFQNLSIETLWINFGVAAVSDQPSFGILPQASFVMESLFVSNQTINVIGATAGSKFTAKEGI